MGNCPEGVFRCFWFWSDCSKGFILSSKFKKRDRPVPLSKADLMKIFQFKPSSESASAEIGRLGGIQDTLGAMRNFSSNVEIATNCCSALWSLCIDGMSFSFIP